MKAKLIKNETEFRAALDRIDELMDVTPGTPEGDELELLVALVDLYEDAHDPIEPPDALGAIQFRMDQMQLSRKDLEQYIGSRSKVSEVMNGKRSLSLRMIRALHGGLGIPADVLLQDPNAQVPPDAPGIDWARFPVREMRNRGWFPSFEQPAAKAGEYAEELVRQLVDPAELHDLQGAMLRQHVRAGSAMDAYALVSWVARVRQVAEDSALAPFNGVDAALVSQMVHLSYLDEGPRLAQELLAKNGIALVVLRHMPRTHLDGAAIMSAGHNPIIALTARHDRLDNFWFTLCHELGHVALHFSDESQTFLDDLDADGDDLERDADAFAAEALVPSAEWRRFTEASDYSAQAVRKFANSLRVHPAIVAGRVRHEQDNFRMLWNLIGKNHVRRFFVHADRGHPPTVSV